MAGRKARDKVIALNGELANLEYEMSNLQVRYEESARFLEQLQALNKKIERYPLPDILNLTWKSVSLAMGWENNQRAAHREVKNQDPSLHALLHLCYFDTYCVLEHIEYAL